MIFLVQFERTTCVTDGLWHWDLLFCVTLKGGFCHFVEGFLDTETLDGRSLIKHHVVVFLSPCLSFWSGNLTFVFLVELVAEANKWERVWVAWSSIFDKPCLPASQVLKAGLRCDVVDESAAIGSTIKCVTQWLELFLAGSVPNLQCDHRVVY